MPVHYKDKTGSARKKAYAEHKAIKKPSIREAARMEARFGAGVDEMQKSIGSAIAGPGAGKKRGKEKKNKKKKKIRSFKPKKPVKGILESQGY